MKKWKYVSKKFAFPWNGKRGKNMERKFPGIYRIFGTVYSDMNCDEALRMVYTYIAESKKTKKLDNYFSIIANHCYVLDNRSTKTFHSDITSKYSEVSWDEAMSEIINKLPKMHYIFPVEVAIGIIVDTCRKADDIDIEIDQNNRTIKENHSFSER